MLDTRPDEPSDSELKMLDLVPEDRCSEAETAIGVQDGVQAETAIGVHEGPSKARKSTRRSRRNRQPKSTASSSTQGLPAGLSTPGMLSGAAAEGHDPDSEEGEADPEWASLQHAVGREAERLSCDQPGLPVECALLKALWSVEGDFSPSLVSRFQVLIADGIAPSDDDISEAQWWFGAQPERGEPL